MLLTGAPPRAVLLDALGTLLHLIDPFGALDRELAARGAAVAPAIAREALLAEMHHYRNRCATARDATSLDALRDECTEVLRCGLPEPARSLPDLRDVLLAAVRFAPYPDVAPALARWRAAGARLAVISNWDVSLHGVLEETGLRPHLDAVITSAEHGASKPDPSLFQAGLDALGIPASDAVHLGDDVAGDIGGARAAGVGAVLVARDGATPPPGVPSVPSFAELWA